MFGLLMSSFVSGSLQLTRDTEQLPVGLKIVSPPLFRLEDRRDRSRRVRFSDLFPGPSVRRRLVSGENTGTSKSTRNQYDQTVSVRRMTSRSSEINFHLWSVFVSPFTLEEVSTLRPG